MHTDGHKKACRQAGQQADISFTVRIFFDFSLTLTRLDKSIFIQGWQWWDPGYKTYVGLLYLDAYYSHPVMITFVRYDLMLPSCCYGNVTL